MFRGQFWRFRRASALAAALAAAAAALLAAAPVQGQDPLPVPPLSGRVVDPSGILSGADRQGLESWLAAHEKAKGTQFAVLLVPTTRPEAIEQYALRVAETWKLGRAGRDDGLLLLVAKEDRTARFEVGYGLEGALPDALCRRILDEIAAPPFRAGDFAGGIRAALEAAAKAIAGEPLPPPESAPASRPDGWVFLFPLLFLLPFLLGRLLGKWRGGLAAGSLVGVAAWFLLGSLLLALLLGFATLVLSFVPIGAFRGGPGSGWGRGGGRGSGGGWGGSGGGFRGGGGKFGGGGASGRW